MGFFEPNLMKNVVIALALIAAAFLLGRRSVKPEIVKIHRTDTVVVRDTVRETVLVPKVRYLTRVDTVLLPVPGDTVEVPVLVPISRKVYEGEDYRAVVSGFRASLDTLDIFRKTQTVTNTVVQRVEVPGKPKRWGIGVSAGYALTPQGVKPYIGAGISYSFITF